ncbi:MAG: DUF167 domain-containing protein [Rhodobacteraceae bacterium]|nr:MAG: DUF167 domain-containing protein [Paracoccaceae bacterium]
MDLRDPARQGASFQLHVTPRAWRPSLSRDPEGRLRVAVTEAPEKGRAYDALRKTLAKALGVAPSRLDLVHGATGRIKVFRLPRTSPACLHLA